MEIGPGLGGGGGGGGSGGSGSICVIPTGVIILLSWLSASGIRSCSQDSFLDHYFARQ